MNTRCIAADTDKNKVKKMEIRHFFLHSKFANVLYLVNVHGWDPANQDKIIPIKINNLCFFIPLMLSITTICQMIQAIWTINRENNYYFKNTHFSQKIFNISFLFFFL